MNEPEADAGREGVVGGPLVVSGGGSTTVATGELFAESAVLRRTEADAEDWLGQVAGIRWRAPVAISGWAYLGGTAELSAAAEAIREVGAEAARLASALDAAAENYGAAERDVQRLFRSLGADMGWLFGATSAIWGPGLVLTAIAATAIGGLLAALITGTPLNELPAEVGEWIADHPEIYTNPAFVELVAVLVASTDDAAAGRMLVPHWLTRLLGDDQLAVFGASTSAAGLTLLLGPLGVGRTTAVAVKPVGAPRSVRPPKDYTDAAERIPPAATGIPQIVIERYPGPSGPEWFVYVGGTVDWSLIPGTEPFDMSSNLQGVGQLAAGSREGVAQAMRAAGIAPGDPVQLFGHSQGGLVVAQVAASKEFGVAGVTTFGAPSGQVAVGASTLAFENGDDAVVATGGRSQHPSPDRLIVGHQAYLGREIPKGEGMPAHQMQAYVDTAGLADASEDPRVLQKKAATFAVSAAAGTAEKWRADRVQPRHGGGGGF